jgi:hypothetical protein
VASSIWKSHAGKNSFARYSSNSMPPYGALPTGNTSSLLSPRTAGICWCGLYIAISGFLIASFWQWSTQETGDLELLLCRPFLMMATDGPRRAVPAHCCRNSNSSSDEHDGKKDRRGGSTGYGSSSSRAAHKFWIHWPNQIRQYQVELWNDSIRSNSGKKIVVYNFTRESFLRGK